MSWDQVPLGYCVTEVKEKNTGGREDNLLSLSYGNIVRRDIATADGLLPESFDSYNVIKPGDTVLRLTDLQNDQRSLRVGLVEEVGIITSAYVTIRPSRVFYPKFLNYFLKHMDFRKDFYALGAGVRQSLKFEELRSVKVSVPALVDQKVIADYLDRETARIDALIEKKRHLVRLLEDRFQTALRINIAAIDAPLSPLKRAWQVIDCKHRTPTYVDEGFPVVSPGDISPGRLNLSRSSRFVNIDDLVDLTDGDRCPQRGDIIYSRNASIGIAAYVDTDESFCLGQDVCLIRSKDQSQLYLSFVLNTIGLDQLNVLKVGSTFSRVNISQIVELFVPIPDCSVQATLASQWDQKAARSKSAQLKIENQIDLLREYRNALVTAAVTGDLKITEVAA